MMDDYKNSDNFQRTEGCKMISPHHFHPTNGVRSSDSNRICKLGSLIIASVMLVSSGCRTPVIPDGVYMADVGESKITMVGNKAELDLLLDPGKKKRYVTRGSVVNGLGIICPDGISGQPIYFITVSTQYSPFEISELSWFYDGQNILAVYPDKKIVTFTLNEAVGSQKTYKHHEGRP